MPIKLMPMKRTMLPPSAWLLALLTSTSASALEVLHWWTAPGEVQAQAVLKQTLAEQGIAWQDFVIDGSGGGSAMRVLQMRALSGNPPDVAQIKGPDIAEWSKIGMLQEVEHIVGNAVWDKHIPEVVKATISYRGQYMALPLNIHRVNWLWLNKAIFDELGLRPPTTWPAFFEAADKIHAAGYSALAHGGTPWQDSLLFESLALSLLGADLYRQAFVDLDEQVLTSAEMIAVFTTFKRLRAYVDSDMRGKDWVVTSEMLTDKKAGMLFMGDWAKGLWHARGKVAMQDYLCVAPPQSAQLYSYNIDSFVFFNQTHQQAITLNTTTFANTLLSEPFQYAFNVHKGSLPIHSNMDMRAFDACTRKSYVDFNNAQLVPSLSQSMATSSYLHGVMSNIISHYFHSDDISAEQVTKQLAVALRAVNK